jgi:hypothetical protein
VGAASLVDGASLPSEYGDVLVGTGACLALLWGAMQPERGVAR